MDKLHGMAGGGQQSEKNEDALDKGNSNSILSYPILSHSISYPIIFIYIPLCHHFTIARFSCFLAVHDSRFPLFPQTLLPR